MEPPGGGRHRWENKKIECAGAYESKREPNEFQSRKRAETSARVENRPSLSFLALAVLASLSETLSCVPAFLI